MSLPDASHHVSPSKEGIVHLLGPCSALRSQDSLGEMGGPRGSKGNREPVRGVRQGQQQKVPEGVLPPSAQCAEHKPS